MTKSIDYKNLSEDVYRVDAKKTTNPIRTDDLVAGSSFQVLRVSDNQSNGMQAMAVAPVVNGVVDYDNITIAYAGTNFSDPNDRRTDLENVIQGREGLTADFRSIENIDSQVDTALEFAADIQKEYPQATLSTTGHSLGGYLALLVSVKNKWASTAFNGPSPDNMLTKEEIAWAKEHTDILVNYRNTKDWLGNYGGDPLGIARYVAPYKDAGLFDILYYHGLSTWKFDKHGNLIDKYGLVVDRQNYRAGVDIDGDGVEDI
ncbi:triacylglycerol lipase, partial [Streptococcus danieliae]|nr:triacylglycerol lipase [Streptococcus acidominimus]MBF0847031.1 triacylglycerol lipase [Streptococcus danieliae]